MNVYMVGIVLAMVISMLLSTFISRKVKTLNDFYVAGRQAPTGLIVGSLIASMLGTNFYMADSALCYEGAFTSVLIMFGIVATGYPLGAVFFGRYLRRSQVLTISEFFGKRFCSPQIRKLSAITSVIAMFVYLISFVQGIGTLMTSVTGFDYNLCVIVALSCITFIVVIAGATGVLITDTVMALFFTVVTVIIAIFISNSYGGGGSAIQMLSDNKDTAQLLSYGGRPGVLYDNGYENVIWGIIYGVVWMSVVYVGPWQASRYLMAKDEHTVVRSAPGATLVFALLSFEVCITAVFVNNSNSMLEDSSQVYIWAGMHLLPAVLGVLLFTGMLLAGISSVTTLLSLIAASITNDFCTRTKQGSIWQGRIVIIFTSIVVLLYAVFNPPALNFIQHMGGAVIACAWMPVAVASVFSKRVTKKGAFWGMFAGFMSSFLIKLFTGIAGVILPVYFDASIIGMICNVLVMVVVSALTQLTEEEAAARLELFVIPASERDVNEIGKTLKCMKWFMWSGVVVAIVLLAFWAIPYLLFS